jgi:hypothetical protein
MRIDTSAVAANFVSASALFLASSLTIYNVVNMSRETSLSTRIFYLTPQSVRRNFKKQELVL